MIRINKYDFKKEEIDNLDKNVFELKQGKEMLLCTRYNKAIIEFSLDNLKTILKGSEFIPYKDIFDDEDNNYRYIVFKYMQDKVIDQKKKIDDKNKEQFALQMLYAIYQIHSGFKSNNKFMRFTFDSYYLDYDSYDPRIKGEVSKAKVKVLFELTPYPRSSGTIGYMDYEVYKSQKEEYLEKFERAYKIHVLDLKDIALALMPDNYQHLQYISDECRVFIKICGEEDSQFVKSFDDLKQFFGVQNSQIMLKSINDGDEEEQSINWACKTTNPHTKNKMFPILKEKRILELAHCYSYYSQTDRKVNEKTKKTLKEEAFEAADSLFDNMTLKANFKPELFPLYEVLFQDYEKYLEKQQKSNGK